MVGEGPEGSGSPGQEDVGPRLGVECEYSSVTLITEYCGYIQGTLWLCGVL